MCVVKYYDHEMSLQLSSSYVSGFPDVNKYKINPVGLISSSEDDQDVLNKKQKFKYIDCVYL